MKFIDKVLTVITEGGRKLGFGHVSRCLSIAKGFQKYGFKIKFLINGDESIVSILDGADCNLFDWIKEQDRLFVYIEKSTCILIDSSLISDELLILLEKTDIPIIFIDDEKRRNTLNRGFVLDWTVLSDKQKYFIPKKENVVYLLGSQYTPLREEFNKAYKNMIKKEVKSILITFGGSDVRNITPCILKKLSIYFPEIKKYVVIGAGFTNIKEIKEIDDKNINLIFNADAKTMVWLMQNSDIAIASGGQTLYELVRVGLPTIAILLVDNAKDDTMGWDKVGAVKYIGWYNDKTLLDKLVYYIKYLQDYKIRLNMQKEGAKYIGTNTTNLLVSSIMEKIK